MSLVPDGTGLRVALKSLTPNFKTSLARIDGSDWKPVANAFTWTPLARSRSDPNDPPPCAGGYTRGRILSRTLHSRTIRFARQPEGPPFTTIDSISRPGKKHLSGQENETNRTH